MRQALLLALAVTVTLVVIIKGTPSSSNSSTVLEPEAASAESAAAEFRTVTGTVKRGESLYDIFKRYGLNINELYAIASASKKTYNLKKLSPGQDYCIKLDGDNCVRSFTYYIDSNSILNIERAETDFKASKAAIPYETTLVHISGTVRDNLVSSIDNLLLALDLSDIFAWDIDFTTDIRNGDSFKLVVEERRLDGEFKKYGKILAAEFTNNGTTHYAYRFEQNGKADYHDKNGRSLRRALLKAPLSYRRISSGFTRKRLHPILKTYRPHLGVDYAAPRGTPVSTVGDGTVLKAGYKGANGRQVIIKHPAGYVTYYGHLNNIKKRIRKGKGVKQGQVIGYVGSTGRATGPHLDYRITKNGSFVNPLTLKLPPGKPVKKSLMAGFRAFKDMMNTRLASIELPVTASTGKTRKQG